MRRLALSLPPSLPPSLSLSGHRYESIPPFLIITFGVAAMGALQHGVNKLTNYNEDFKVRRPPPAARRTDICGEPTLASSIIRGGGRRGGIV